MLERLCFFMTMASRCSLLRFFGGFDLGPRSNSNCSTEKVSESIFDPMATGKPSGTEGLSPRRTLCLLIWTEANPTLGQESVETVVKESVKVEEVSHVLAS